MLPLIGVLAFALLSLAALATDLGLAAAQQNRLEAAAEAAALGALREDARVQYDLARGEVAENHDCDAACLAREVLGEKERPVDDRAEVDLGPGVVDLDPVPCGGEICSAWKLTQAIPLLFGQASLLSFQGGSLRELTEARAGGSLLGDGAPVKGALRARGIPIGAEAQARAEPALAVGEPSPSPEGGWPGRAPFALELGFWSSLETETLDVQDGALLDESGDEVGQTLRNGIGFRAGSTLGASAAAVLAPGQQPVYVPLYVPASAERIVVGFGFARISVSEPTVSVTRLGVRVAPGNASASPRFLGEHVTVVLDARADPRALDSLVQAPALRR